MVCLQDTDQNVPDAPHHASSTAQRAWPPSPVQSFFQVAWLDTLPFQRDAWTAYAQGKSGLIHAPTGLGKTYAAFLCRVCAWSSG